MIDIHCHVLPSIDDGAKNIHDAVALCSLAEQQGITAIVSTPHFAQYEEIDAFCEARAESYESLCSAAEHESIGLDIKTGCELYLDEMIFSAPSLDRVTLNGSRYMLCEFSLSQFDINEALSWIDELRRREYVPILAHPERYRPLQLYPEAFNELAERRILFQINADSLVGKNGQSSYILACDLLMKNMVDFIASDAHSAKYRPNDLLRKIKYFPDFIDTDMLEAMLETNPKAVIGDRMIHIPKREEFNIQ